MCGIAGWKLTEKPNPQFVLAMAYGILERGYESFGYFDGQNITKDVGAITEGIRASDMLSPCGFIHTRHSTTGKVNKANSHPFAIGDIVGAHNGMVYNHADVQKEYKRNLAVDSMHIFQHMVESKPLTELEGYGAIEFFRNGQWFVGACNAGALEVAKLKNDAGLIWASTKDCIEAAIFQGGFELDTYYTIEQGHVYRVETDCLYETEQVFNLAKYITPVTFPSFDGKPYGGFTDNWFGSAKYRQDNWYKDFDTKTQDEKLPASFFDSVTTDHVYDECEFCNEIARLYEYEGSMICEQCARTLGVDVDAIEEGEDYAY